jgi:20S proteasome subunit beta 7
MRYRNPDLLGPISSIQAPAAGPKRHTQNPIVTGTSVVALKYKDGVMAAADTLGSYGTLARFTQLERIKVFGDVLVAGSGDLSDVQFIFDEITALRVREFTHDDGQSLSGKQLWNFLTRVLYERRNKGDPIYVQLVIADVRNGESFLAQTDLHGTNFEDTTIATGFGAHLARPILRNLVGHDNGKPLPSKEEAQRALEECMRVLFYRDCKTINRVQFADVTREGIKITEPAELKTNWEIGNRPADPRGLW